MNRRLSIALGFSSLFAFGACEAFEDPTPTNIIFELRGETGKQVDVVYSTQFVAGVDEFGVTQVTVFASDTVRHTMPIDTVINIEIPRQWFVQVIPLGSDTLNVDAIVDVDDRNLLAESGGIFPGSPWNFVYMFNRALTRIVEVEI